MRKTRHEMSKLISNPRRFASLIATVLGETLFALMQRRRSSGAMKLSDLRRVLVVRPDEIGDVVMTIPFLRELRRNLPQARISLLIKPALRNLAELCPYVDELIVYDREINGSFVTLRSWARMIRFARRELWPRHFELAIFPRWDAGPFEGPRLTYLSGAPWRVGYSEHLTPWKKIQNRGCDRYFTHFVGKKGMQHEVLNNLDVISFLGGRVESERLEIWTAPEDESFADEALRTRGISSADTVMAFGVGTRLGSKRWPYENFCALSLELVKDPGARVILLGGPEDQSLGASPSSEGIIDLRGKTTLRQVAALLKRCTLYVGNDTGAMHMAAAVDTPVVQVSCHLQNGSPLVYPWPDQFGAWQVPQVLVKPTKPTPPCVDHCNYGESHCIQSVPVDQVARAAREMLRLKAAS
jgi:ADP-heptose:LPS heptosyltransferase